MKSFAETFHSCFKDGLDGTIDYRMIPIAIIFISILFAIVLSLPSSSMRLSISLNCANTVGCICVILSPVISYLRPCKSLIMNMSLSFHATLLGLLGILLGLWEQNFLVSTEGVAVIFVILPLVAHTVIILWTGYNIIISVQSGELCNLHIFKRIFFTLKAFMKGSNEYEEIGAGGNNNSQQLQIP